MILTRWPPRFPLLSTNSQQEGIDRRERLRRLALETIDLAKDPYFMRNHLGQYECRLCLTLHNNEGNYLAHTQVRALRSLRSTYPSTSLHTCVVIYAASVSQPSLFTDAAFCVSSLVFLRDGGINRTSQSAPPERRPSSPSHLRPRSARRRARPIPIAAKLSTSSAPPHPRMQRHPFPPHV